MWSDNLYLPFSVKHCTPLLMQDVTSAWFQITLISFHPILNKIIIYRGKARRQKPNSLICIWNGETDTQYAVTLLVFILCKRGRASVPGDHWVLGSILVLWWDSDRVCGLELKRYLHHHFLTFPFSLRVQLAKFENAYSSSSFGSLSTLWHPSFIKSLPE